jgi:hypothetical protein
MFTSIEIVKREGRSGNVENLFAEQIEIVIKLKIISSKKYNYY